MKLQEKNVWQSFKDHWKQFGHQAVSLNPDGGSEFEFQLSLCVLRVWTGQKSAGQNGSEPRRVWRRRGGASLSRSRNTWGGELRRKRRRGGRKQELRRKRRRGNQALTAAGTPTSTTQREWEDKSLLLYRKFLRCCNSKLQWDKISLFINVLVNTHDYVEQIWSQTAEYSSQVSETAKNMFAVWTRFGLWWVTLISALHLEICL